MEFNPATKIESVTIYGMHHITKKTYNFHDINYLFGKNGAGKSTILNAIQLAILGYIPGTAKQTSAIFQHANGPEMRIVVIFDNGQVIDRKWRIKGRSIESQLTGNFSEEQIKELVADLELPIFNFTDLIGFTANKLKDWFINFLPSDTIDIDWKKELLDSLNGIQIMDPEILDRTLEFISTDDQTLIEKIQALNAQMKQHQSFYKSELQRSEATIQSLIYYDEDGLVGDDAYLDEEVQKAHARIIELTSEKEQLIRAVQADQSNQQIQNQISAITIPKEDMLEQMSANLESIGQFISQLESEIFEIQKAMFDNSTKISELTAELKSKESIIRSGGTCPYTQGRCDSIVKMISDMEQEASEIRGKIAEIKQADAGLSNDFSKKKQQLDDNRQQYQSVNLEIQQARNASTTVSRLYQMMQNVPDTSNFATVDFYTNEIARLNQQISKIQANKQYNALVDKLTADKYRLENSIEVYKCWAKLTDPNGLQTKVMKAPFDQLRQDMDSYLSIMFSEDVKCHFNLEQKANSFSLGILRKTGYIPYDLLSSGEKTMFTLALMLCIINKSKSNLKILIVDDMLDHLDDSRADDVFSALRKIEDIQIILAGVKESGNAESIQINVM